MSWYIRVIVLIISLRCFPEDQLFLLNFDLLLLSVDLVSEPVLKLDFKFVFEVHAEALDDTEQEEVVHPLGFID